MSEIPLACADVARWLDAYVDGEAAECLGISEQQFIDHLVACRPCLDEVLLTRRLKQVMSTRCTQAAPPETLRQTVFAQVYQASFTSQASWESHSVWTEQR